MVGVAVNVAEVPLHAGFVPDVSEIATEGLTLALIVKLLPLLVPVMLGVLLITLIL